MALQSGDRVMFLDDLFKNIREGKECCNNLLCDIPERAIGELSMSEVLVESSREVDWFHRKSVDLISVTDDAYPLQLAECQDAPALLYYRGNVELSGDRLCAVVGTRMPTAYGKECTGDIVSHLARLGCTIISGLAYGIDVAAHRSALEHDALTLAVLPNGIDSIYPEPHRSVAANIVEHGGIVTEFPKGVEPVKMNFIKRNRIIAGLSRSVIIPESRIHGGAMSTAHFAFNYGRDLYAVPGRVTDTNSGGCNYLISKCMAAAINRIEQIGDLMGFDLLPFGSRTLEKRLFFNDDEKKRKILLSLKDGLTMTADEICAECGISFSDVSMILLELELEGLVCSNLQGAYKRR